MAFDFTPLVPPGLPPPAARWTGAARYNFTFGNNDPEGLAVDDLRSAADAALAREGRRLADYRLLTGPQGYKPLREFLVKKLKRKEGFFGKLNRKRRSMVASWVARMIGEDEGGADYGYLPPTGQSTSAAAALLFWPAGGR